MSKWSLGWGRVLVVVVFGGGGGGGGGGVRVRGLFSRSESYL